jgi:hypothetical protein
MRSHQCRAAGTNAVHSCWAANLLLAGMFFTAVSLLAQRPLQEPAPLPEVAIPAGMDSNEVGQQSPAVNAEVVKKSINPFDPLEYDIARWEKFLEQARQEVAALQGSTNPSNRAEAARLNRVIPEAEAHLAALQQEKKLRKDCGLSQLLADWMDLKHLVEEGRKRIEPAAAMAQNTNASLAPVFNMMGGAAGGALISGGTAVMQRQLETDADAVGLAQSNIGIIQANCEGKPIDDNPGDTPESFERRREAGNKVAEEAAAKAQVIAANGQFKDEEDIAALLTIVLGASRQNQLMGYGDKGMEQQKKAQEVFKTFINSAADKCGKESFQVVKAYQLDRMNEMLAVGGDLSSCKYRLFEASGLAGELPYRLRHCGESLDGTWKIEVTRGQINGATGKLQGEAEVPGFGASSALPSFQGVSGILMESGSASIEAVGHMADAVVNEGTMRVQGTIAISVENYVKDPPGVLIHQDIKMHADLNLAGFNATPVGGGSATHYPGMSGPQMDIPITIINGNKPCDPNKDVWKYPPGP